MNKKVLSALLFGALMAGTGTFTSCIDNDEPAGIEELRGAKAELIRAKVEVEKANAAVQNAEAKRLEAVAAVEQANAAFRQAQAKQEEAKAASLEAKAEADKAYYDKMIAEYEAEMLVAAEELKAKLAAAKQWAAEAEFAYNTALKQIAIAEALDLDNKTSLMFLKGEIENRYNAIYVNTYANGKTLVEAIRDAEEDLYDAMLAKSAGIDGEDLNSNPTIWIPTLEAAVAGAEAVVEAQNEKIAKLESFLEMDVETADWRAEIEELNDSAEALKLAISETEIEIEKQLNGEEYLAAKQKVEGVNAGGAVEKGTQDLLYDAKNDYNAYAQGGTLANGEQVEAKELSLTTIKLGVSSALVSYVNDGIATANVNVALSTDAKGNSYVTIANTVGTDDKKVYKQPRYDVKLDENNYQPAKAVKEIEKWEKALAKTEISAQTIEQKKRELPNKVETEAEADSLYNEVALPLWQSALAVMDGGAATATIPAAETKKVTDAIAAYNAKVAAATAAATAYTTAYNNIFDTDSVAKLNELYYEKYWNTFKVQAQADLEGANVYNDATLAKNAIKLAILDLEADAYEAMIAAVEALYVTKVKDDADATNGSEAAAAQKLVDKALSDNKFDAKAAADKAQHGNATTWEGLAGDAGDAAVAADIAKGDNSVIKAAEKAKNDAADEVPTAYNTLKTAYEAYNTLAKDYYALVPAEGAKGMPASGTAVAEADAPKMVLLALAKAESGLREAAWNKTSELAFGVAGRYVAMEEKDVTSGALYNWAVAKKDLAACQDEIAAADKLAELVKALADAKTALAAETAANEAKFADLKAAVVAADKANETAKAELKAIEDELIGDLRIEQAKLKAKYNAVYTLAGEIAREVANHLHLDGVTSYTDAAGFEKALEDNLKTAKTELIEFEQAVAKAEAELQKAKDGKYDAVADAQYKLDQLNAELARRQAKYEQALADLETALAAIAE